MNRHETISAASETPLGVGDAFVAICDWKGTVRWLSNQTIKTRIGDLGWSNMIPEDAERFKAAFARTATLHERLVVEITSLNGLRYRIWLMSIGVPELAVCTFNLRIPPEIEFLSDRERELMSALSTGISVKEAAAELDCSVNTIHSHMKSVKTKLGLSSPAEVVSFASRYFNNLADPLKIGQPGPIEAPSQKPKTAKTAKRSTAAKKKR